MEDLSLKITVIMSELWDSKGRVTNGSAQGNNQRFILMCNRRLMCFSRAEWQAGIGVYPGWMRTEHGIRQGLQRGSDLEHIVKGGHRKHKESYLEPVFGLRVYTTCG